MWRIQNEPCNSTSYSHSALRLLIVFAGRFYWGLHQVTSSFSIWGCVLKGQIAFEGHRRLQSWTLGLAHLLTPPAWLLTRFAASLRSPSQLVCVASLSLENLLSPSLSPLACLAVKSESCLSVKVSLLATMYEQSEVRWWRCMCGTKFASRLRIWSLKW